MKCRFYKSEGGCKKGKEMTGADVGLVALSITCRLRARGRKEVEEAPLRTTTSRS